MLLVDYLTINIAFFTYLGKSVPDAWGRQSLYSNKELEKEYMKAMLAKVGTPAPAMIGVDEISIRKGHTYRIVVSDL
ncbi:MAG: hypothetical protein ABSF43_12120, partial [Rectinemataceae bacterium]